jgi:hypothetical protein
MTFASVQELVEGTRQVIDLNGGVRVKDPAALRGQVIDRLVHTAVSVRRRRRARGSSGKSAGQSEFRAQASTRSIRPARAATTKA